MKPALIQQPNPNTGAEVFPSAPLAGPRGGAVAVAFAIVTPAEETPTARRLRERDWKIEQLERERDRAIAERDRARRERDAFEADAARALDLEAELKRAAIALDYHRADQAKPLREWSDLERLERVARGESVPAVRMRTLDRLFDKVVAIVRRFEVPAIR